MSNLNIFFAEEPPLPIYSSGDKSMCARGSLPWAVLLVGMSPVLCTYLVLLRTYSVMMLL